MDSLVAEARKLSSGPVAHFGVSMGGYFAAYTGLSGMVDASFVLGGPVEKAFDPDKVWQFGMEGILGNAAGFDSVPTSAQIAERLGPLSLRSLLDKDDNCPMLVINGAEDVHLPTYETTVFEGRRDTEVHLLEGTGHCAVSRLPEVMALAIPWLAARLSR